MAEFCSWPRADRRLKVGRARFTGSDGRPLNIYQCAAGAATPAEGHYAQSPLIDGPLCGNQYGLAGLALFSMLHPKAESSSMVRLGPVKSWVGALGSECIVHRAAARGARTRPEYHLYLGNP